MAAVQPVALVVHRRIRDEGFGDFSKWLARVAERMRSWPGFLGQEVVPPSPPFHVDWTIVQRFESVEAARGWLTSDDRPRLIDEISDCFVGEEDLHLLPDTGTWPQGGASAMITFDVPPADEAAFMKWQARVQAAEARFPGFRRHKLERPVPGIHDDWLVVLNFDSDANLGAWLDSAERRALIEASSRFGSDINIKRTNYGFDFWFPAQAVSPSSRHGVFKSNLLILAVLYPVVFAWTYFVSAPFLDTHGVPFWLSLFLGNFVSTQVLGWWLAPLVFRLFRWWIPPGLGLRRQLAGYAAILALYALALAVCALPTAHGWS